MQNNVIREAIKEDAPIISLLARVTFSETFGHHFRDKNDLLVYLDSTFSVDKIEKSIEKSSNFFWLAFVNKLPVGYAKLKLDSPSDFLSTDKVCQLQKIYVLKDFLSMKIGFELQDKLFKKARSSDSADIWLAVLDSNVRAQNFYRKNGFKVIGSFQFSIGKENFNHLVMASPL